jgi:predicted transcriptional regulator
MDLNIHVPKNLETVLSYVPDKHANAIDAMRKKAEQDRADYEVWARKKIQEGVAAADRGEFVPDDEMREFFIKCGVNVTD